MKVICCVAERCKDEECEEIKPHEPHILDGQSCTKPGYCFQVDLDVRCIPIKENHERS